MFELILTVEVPLLRVMPMSVAEGESIAYMNCHVCLWKLLPRTGELKGKIQKYPALSWISQEETEMKCEVTE